MDGISGIFPVGTPCATTAGNARQHVPPPRRPQPIRDAILTYLADEPRQALAVAAHIARPVATATGHLAAMRRRGLVVRVGWGVYARADRWTAPPPPGSIARGNPVRECVLACLDREDARSLDAIARLAGRSASTVLLHLRTLVRAGLADQVAYRRYRRADPGSATAASAPPPLLRPRPVQAAVLDRLGEHRTAQEVAAELGMAERAACGALRALIRSGEAVQTSAGLYLRADRVGLAAPRTTAAGLCQGELPGLAPMPSSPGA